MRKIKSARKLGRTASHRSATLSNLSTSLLKHKRIQTTEAKAKETRRVVEQILTRAKEGTLHAQREVFKVIRDKAVIKELFTDIASKIAERNGGYTRVIKLPRRFGDAAKMAMIELVDYSEAANEKKQQKQDRKKRVQGSKQAKSTEKGEDKGESKGEAKASA